MRLDTNNRPTGISMARNWWTTALRGIFAILFGLLLFLWPGISLLALVYLFGIFALIGGGLSLVAVWSDRRSPTARIMLLLEGILGIAVGILAFLWPRLSALALVYVIAVWAILIGIFELVASVRLRAEIEQEWLLGLAGLLSILFGVFIAFFPRGGALAILWLIGAYAIVYGILQVILALRQRQRQHRS